MIRCCVSPLGTSIELVGAVSSLSIVQTYSWCKSQSGPGVAYCYYFNLLQQGCTDMDQFSAISLKCYSLLLVKNKSSNSIACMQRTMSVGSMMTYEREYTSNTAILGTRVPGQRILLKFACLMRDDSIVDSLRIQRRYRTSPAQKQN